MLYDITLTEKIQQGTYKKSKWGQFVNIKILSFNNVNTKHYAQINMLLVWKIHSLNIFCKNHDTIFQDSLMNKKSKWQHLFEIQMSLLSF